jgi:tetratricopeptide (TPR) repeat protein
MRHSAALVVLAVTLFTSVARADDLADAKNYFKAGASAYAAGDYLAAIQALDAAYRLTPLPQIAFSLAQAERRQYFASREPGHLLRAIELYRTYLKEVPTGGRRADATDALAQLEPLALGVVASPTGEAVPREAPKTRVMVSSEAAGARISLDGGPPKPTPLIAEVQPGQHVVRVSAEGYFEADRQLVAISGELVPLEVELKERPAVVIVEPSTEADLYVDGSFSGRVDKGSRIELSRGPHQFAFARPGRNLEIQTVKLERGETRRLPVELDWTGQRIAAISILAVSGATLATGVVFTALAVDQENQADRILAQREKEALSPSELADYEDAREERDRYRAVAIGSYAVSAASLVTGAFLYVLDEPNVGEIVARKGTAPVKPQVELKTAASSNGFFVATRVMF